MVPSKGIDRSTDNQGQHGDDGDHNCHSLECSRHLLTSTAPVYEATPGWASQFKASGPVTPHFLSFSKDTLIQFQSITPFHSVDWGCSREDTPRSRQEKPTCADGLFSLSCFRQVQRVKRGGYPVPGCESGSRRF
jgi:hypothetical protein